MRSLLKETLKGTRTTIHGKSRYTETKKKLSKTNITINKGEGNKRGSEQESIVSLL